MKSLAEHMSFYHRYHTKTSTKITHFIGVPLIVLSLMMVLNWFQIGLVTGQGFSIMWVSVIILCIYYLRLHIPLAIGMAVIFGLMGWFVNWFTGNIPTTASMILVAALFVIGWVIQFIGHAFEGKKPALLDNLFQVFIAPIFLLAEVFFMLGAFKKLKQAVLKNP